MADMGTDGWCRCLVVLSPLSTPNLLLSLCAGYVQLNTSISTHSLLQHFLFERVFSSGVTDCRSSGNEGIFSRKRTLFKVRSYEHLTDDGGKCRNLRKIAIVRSDKQTVNHKCQFFRSSLSVGRYRKIKNYPNSCQYSHSPLKVAWEYEIW